MTRLAILSHSDTKHRHARSGATPSTASGAASNEGAKSGSPVEAVDLVRIAFVVVIAVFLGRHIWDGFGHPYLVGLITTVAGGYPIYRDALANVRERGMTLELSMTIALGVALVIGDAFTAVLITGFVLVADAIETLALWRGARAINTLVEFLPRHVPVHPDHGFIEAVGQAGRNRAPIQQMAERLADYLVYCGFAAAVVTFLITRDVRAAISVVIFSGAYGLAAGTFLAMHGAIGRAGRFGAIVKGGHPLEALWSVDKVVLDKTGTTTFGESRVRATYSATGITVRDLVEAAVTAEARSEHPIGRAIVRYATEKSIQPLESAAFSDVPGQGVRAMAEGEEILVGTSSFITGGRLQERSDYPAASTTVFVSRGGRYLGSVSVAEEPRPEAKQAIAAMRALNLTTCLVTSDSRAATALLARDLGVDDFETDLKPESKVAFVRTVAEKHRVAMVGDGVNSAPALAVASVGVAMGRGTEASSEKADIVLLGNDLLKFVQVIHLARRTRGVIRQNFVVALIVDNVGIALAAAGIVTPLLAAVVHLTSELLIIFNSARLVPSRQPDS